MKRRILGLFIAVCMALPFIGQLPVEKVFAAEVVDSGNCGENVTWTLDSDGLLVISGTGAMDDYSWTCSSPFYNNDNIKSANIENGITSIGDFTFSGCSSLTSITLPDSVTSIGNSAFCNCSSLTSITLPISVVSILESAFAVCSNLTDVYYFGDEADKDKISIEGGNETLKSAKWHYMKEADEEKQDEILKYYHDVLVNNDNRGDFNIICLSNDNIPDLIYRSSDKTNISVYINGSEEASTGYYASALNIEYYPETGFFKQYNDGSEEYPEYYVVDIIENKYFLFETLSVVTYGFYYNYPWDGESGQYFNINYNKWIKNEEITEQAFDEKIAQFSKGKEKIKCEWFDNNIIGRSVFFPDEFEILNAENECEILYEGQKVYFRFIPDETSEYVIESSGDDDTYITLYCADDMNSILAADDDSGDGNNFKLIYTLEAGKEYYYVPRFLSNGAGTINFSFKEYSSEQVNITFDGNGLILGYDVESATPSIQRQYEFGENVKDPTYYLGYEDKNGLTIARWIREWSTDKNGENIVNFDSLTAQENMILYAIRGKSFSVNFDYNVFSKDGKGTDVFDVLKGKSLNDAYPYAPRFLMGYYMEDNSYYTPAVMSFDKNRIFIGWSTDKEGSNIVDMNYVPEDDTILYAIGDSAELDSGTSIPLTARINIAGLDTSEISLKWESSNPDVASLTDNGATSQILTAKQSGKTTITATYTDSNGKTASATCEITVRDSAQPVHVHNIKKTTAKAATCTATGNSEYYTCAECGKYFRDSEGKNEITKDSWIIAAMGHDYVSAITAPTCTEKGYTTYTCSRCGDSYVADEVAALGHNWGEWKVIKEATKTETGIEKRICSHDISHAEIRVIEKITDDQSSSTQPADQPASGGSQTGSGVQFTDVTADTVVPTSLKAISWAVDNGIVKGYSDNTFKPEAICTREQFTIMLWRFAGEPSSDASAVNRFTDVSDFSNNTSKKAVAWAVEQSIIKGFSDGSFRPKEDITRAQVAVMLWRFAGEESVSATSKFSDISSYSSSVQNAIIWEESAGVASGYKDGTFKPDDGCQRQHMAIFLYRFNSKVEQYKPLG